MARLMWLATVCGERSSISAMSPVREPFLPDEAEYFPSLLGEASHCRCGQTLELGALDVFVGGLGWCRARHLFLGLLRPGSLPELIQASVPNDRVEEGSEGTLLPQPSAPAPEADESRLGHVFRIPASGQQPVGETDEGSPVLLHECPEGLGVSSPKIPDHHGIGGWSRCRIRWIHGPSLMDSGYLLWINDSYDLSVVKGFHILFHARRSGFYQSLLRFVFRRRCRLGLLGSVGRGEPRHS